MECQCQLQGYAQAFISKGGKFKDFQKKKVDRISRKEMNDLRKNGLCFNCKHKWMLKYKCNALKCLIVTTQEEESEEELESMDELDQEEVDESQEPIGQCFALANKVTPNSMRVIDILSGKKVDILIDTGSTHNFMRGGVDVQTQVQS
jgi:hypothetical protein